MGKINYTTGQLSELLATLSSMPAPSEIQTRQDAEATYQPAGNYLTESALTPYATVAALQVLSQSVESLASALTTLQTRFETLLGNGDVSAVIDSFAEMEAFLAGITNAQTLTGMLAQMRTEIVAQIPVGTASQSALDSVSARVTAVETSSATHDSGLETLQTAMAKRPALPANMTEGALYIVKNGQYVCLCGADEQLLSVPRD